MNYTSFCGPYRGSVCGRREKKISYQVIIPFVIFIRDCMMKRTVLKACRILSGPRS